MSRKDQNGVKFEKITSTLNQIGVENAFVDFEDEFPTLPRAMEERTSPLEQLVVEKIMWDMIESCDEHALNLIFAPVPMQVSEYRNGAHWMVSYTGCPQTDLWK